MTWFTLPPLQAGQKSAFLDSRSAAAWLAEQPLANAPVMLAEFLAQIRVINTCRISPIERFKTLGVLRSALFAVSGECQRRYENKPLPLLPAEQAIRDSVCALWRACTVCCLHSLRACLEGDASISPVAAKVAHRALSCLRMEQMNCYLAGSDLDRDFWLNLHSVLVSAETLGVARVPIEDRLLGETKDSTVSGQYAMALLLHLARPFALSRGQIATVTRWLARWREQTRILTEPDTSAKSCCIALDLSLDRPFHDNLRTARLGRWLSVGPVLRKISQRIESLSAGELPEALKLGSGLSAEGCIDLLSELAAHLKSPQQTIQVVPENADEIRAASGLENAYRVLGGVGLSDVSTRSSSYGNQLSEEQIAVFGHVVRNEGIAGKSEQWRVLRLDRDEIQLYRPARAGDSRLALRNLVFLQEQPDGPFFLASVSSLYSSPDGGLWVVARPFVGEPLPLLMEIRDRTSGVLSRHPAFSLPAGSGTDPASIFLSSGVTGRAAAVRFFEARENSNLAVRLESCIERGNDYERWRLAVSAG